MPHTEPANPFRFSTPLERSDDLVGRDAELAALERLGRSGTYTMLEAPRRYGKTSLLKAAAWRWREQSQALAVWVDFSAVLTIDEGLNKERLPSLKGIMAAKKKPLEVKPVTLTESRVVVRRLELPPERAAGRIIGEGAAAVPELVRLLQTEAKVL